MTWAQAGIWLFTIAIICDTAHVLCPIVLAWSHPGLRQIALARPVETMLLPTLAFCMALILPFMLVMWIYTAWNIWHFGSQNYGVGRLLGLRLNKWFYIGATTIMMAVIPLLNIVWWQWVTLVVIDFNHWLVDIGLSSRVSRHWWMFGGAVLILGCCGLLWHVPRPTHVATLAIPMIVQARQGVGFAHFLYSRWCWKLSDPQVRAAIGRDLALA